MANRNRALLVLLTMLILGLSSAHVVANSGAWVNWNNTGNCDNGHSYNGTGASSKTIMAESTAAGWQVITQTNYINGNSCTTPSATYGNSTTENCAIQYSKHRCHSVN